MISIFPFIFSIILFTQFENSSEQPRPFDLNELPPDESSSSNTVHQERGKQVKSRTVYPNTHSSSKEKAQKKLEKSFMMHYETDQNKEWPILQNLTENVAQWSHFCLYLLRKSSEKPILKNETYCTSNGYKTNHTIYKVTYLHEQYFSKEPIENIDILRCTCYKIPPPDFRKPDYIIYVTKYSDSQYFVAENIPEFTRIANLVAFVQNVPSELVNSLNDKIYYHQSKNNFHF